MFHFGKKMHLLRFFVKILRFFLDNYFSLFTQKPHPLLCFFLNKKNQKYLFLTLFIPFYNLFATSITSSPFASSYFAFVSRHCFTLKITTSAISLFHSSFCYFHFAIPVISHILKNRTFFIINMIACALCTHKKNHILLAYIKFLL